MLVCYHNQQKLPRNDLVNLAFRFALYETVSEIELLSGFDDDDDDEDMAVGYLNEVPFLDAVPLCVQVELLGEVWSRHRSRERFESTLLDAAVVFAAFAVTTRIVIDELELAVTWLADDRRKLNPRILHRAPERLEELFDRWWDDRDFLLLEEFHDMPPEQARSARAALRIPDRVVQPMFDVLERGRVSPDVGEKLDGLVSAKEIQQIVPLLLRRPWETRRSIDESTEDDDDSSVEWGLEDAYHGLFVGPCDPDMIEREADCGLVWEIGVSGDDGFDCSHEEWSEHLRDVVHRAADQADVDVDVVAVDGDVGERVRQAIENGLGDGNQIEHREDGWVVVDDMANFLTDVEHAAWVVGDDDEGMPPLFFDTAEAAVLAFERSQLAAELRAKRREEALRRLGRPAER